jgi:hypothetical protein
MWHTFGAKIKLDDHRPRLWFARLWQWLVPMSISSLFYCPNPSNIKGAFRHPEAFYGFSTQL